jgi:hypothetical protein
MALHSTSGCTKCLPPEEYSIETGEKINNITGENKSPKFTSTVLNYVSSMYL